MIWFNKIEIKWINTGIDNVHDPKKRLLAYMKSITDHNARKIEAVRFYRAETNSNLGNAVELVNSLAEKAGWNKVNHELDDYSKGLLSGMLIMLLLCAAIFLLIN